MADEQNTAGAAQPNLPQIQFNIQRIYLKDLSFESPLNLAERAKLNPQVKQDLNTRVNKLADDLFEVVVQVTITVSQDDEKTAFLVEVHQAGQFKISTENDAQLQHILLATCPNMLFPYAREAIDNLSVRGGFPPLNLPPINFEGIYLQSLAKKRAEENPPSEPPTH